MRPYLAVSAALAAFLLLLLLAVLSACRGSPAADGLIRVTGPGEPGDPIPCLPIDNWLCVLEGQWDGTADWKSDIPIGESCVPAITTNAPIAFTLANSRIEIIDGRPQIRFDVTAYRAVLDVLLFDPGIYPCTECSCEFGVAQVDTDLLDLGSNLEEIEAIFDPDNLSLMMNFPKMTGQVPVIGKEDPVDIEATHMLTLAVFCEVDGSASGRAEVVATSNFDVVARVPGGGGGGSCCMSGGRVKIKVLTMQYTGESCAASSHSQDPTKVSCSGDPGFASPVHILATEPSEQHIWFDGLVPMNGTYDIDATNAGQTRIGGDTIIRISSPIEGLLQEVSFHTSCSEPLFIGDQFGANLVVGCEDEEGHKTGGQGDLILLGKAKATAGFVQVIERTRNDCPPFPPENP